MLQKSSLSRGEQYDIRCKICLAHHHYPHKLDCQGRDQDINTVCCSVLFPALHQTQLCSMDLQFIRICLSYLPFHLSNECQTPGAGSPSTPKSYFPFSLAHIAREPQFSLFSASSSIYNIFPLYPYSYPSLPFSFCLPYFSIVPVIYTLLFLIFRCKRNLLISVSWT